MTSRLGHVAGAGWTAPPSFATRSPAGESLVVIVRHGAPGRIGKAAAEDLTPESGDDPSGEALAILPWARREFSPGS